MTALALMGTGYSDDASTGTGGGNQPATPKQQKPKAEAPPVPFKPCTDAEIQKNKATGKEWLTSLGSTWDDLDAEWQALDSLWSEISGWCHRWRNGPNTAFGLGGLSDQVWAQYESKRSDAAGVQARHGIQYIRTHYSSPQQAWAWWNCTKDCNQRHNQPPVPQKEKGRKAWY